MWNRHVGQWSLTSCGMCRQSRGRISLYTHQVRATVNRWSFYDLGLSKSAIVTGEIMLPLSYLWKCLDSNSFVFPCINLKNHKDSSRVLGRGSAVSLDNLYAPMNCQQLSEFIKGGFSRFLWSYIFSILYPSPSLLCTSQCQVMSYVRKAYLKNIV